MLEIVWTKFLVFTGSAALAGVAGALYTAVGGSASAQQFQFLESIVLFVGITLAGGVMLSSALLAGLGLAWAPVIGTHIPVLGSNFQYILFGLGIIAIGRNPNAVGVLYAAGRRLVEGSASTLGWWRNTGGGAGDQARHERGGLPWLSCPAIRSGSASAGSRPFRTSTSGSRPAR